MAVKLQATCKHCKGIGTIGLDVTQAADKDKPVYIKAMCKHCNGTGNKENENETNGK